MVISEIKEQVRQHMFTDRRGSYYLSVILPVIIYALLSTLAPFIVLIPQGQASYIYGVGIMVVYIYTLMTLPLVLATSIPVSKRKGNAKPTSTFIRNYSRNGFRYFRGRLVSTQLTTMWTLALILPGYIKRFSYMMTPYILRDNPDMSIMGAITKSREMMVGSKRTAINLYLHYNWMLLFLNSIILVSFISFIYYLYQVDGEMFLAISFFTFMFFMLVRTLVVIYMKPRWILAKTYLYHSIKK